MESLIIALIFSLHIMLPINVLIMWRTMHLRNEMAEIRRNLLNIKFTNNWRQ
jgi:hypothetical protein